MKWLLLLAIIGGAAYAGFTISGTRALQAEYIDALAMCATNLQGGAAKLDALEMIHGKPDVPFALAAEILICQSSAIRERIGL